MTTEHKGVLFAILAYGAWGILPAYWKLLSQVPVANLLSLRIVGSALCGTALLFALRRGAEIGAICKEGRILRRLGLSSVLLTGNWLVYLWAVVEGRIVEASLGYYITPLLNVGWGVIGDRENLARHQWLAFAIAAIGVCAMAIDLGSLPWISLVLACSFSTYGFIRKRTQASSLGGQSVEALLMSIPAAASFFIVGGAFGGAERSTAGMWLLLLAGPVTIAPLVWFAAAAKNLPYSKLGLFQYISPSLQLLLAVAVYEEPFGVARAVTFSFIGLAIGIYIFGSLRKRRSIRPTRTAVSASVRTPRDK